MTRAFFIVFLFCLLSCSQNTKEQKLFVDKKDTGITFRNDLSYTEDFNPYLYRNFYNGGGVACGDINNDGLIDIYFTGNQTDNKLYLNQGNFTFKDITVEAGLACANVWSTGVNMVDINGDGFLDIYVCKGGRPDGPRRHNELFINNGDLSFTESSKEYGLDIEGLSIQSAFLDFDRDGDLDCYILNNSTKPIGGGLDLKSGSRDESSSDGNKFMLNDNGIFRDVASDIGIYNSEIGFGLGITISDFNNDDWPDIYISNDFFEKDYLYINQQNGTFKEEGDKYFDALPLGAMGADAGDLNNNGYTDLMVTEMLPKDLSRKKTKAIYESWKKYQLAVKQGYAHQFPRNTLQVNQGGRYFSEIGRLSGLDATDWSWSCLIQDYDNDGYKDIFITNGIYKDLLDRDYLVFIADKERVANMIKSGEEVIKNLIDSMPSKALSNYMFSHKGNWDFEDKSSDWGLDEAGFSNGCAYADLDNDGDLDLIVNNVNDVSKVYENQSELLTNNSSVSFSLSMPGENSKAIGAKMILHCANDKYLQELYPSRGFQSSVSHNIHFGIGSSTNTIDSLQVIWPDGYTEVFTEITQDRLNQINYKTSKASSFSKSVNNLSVKLDTLLGNFKTPLFDQFDRDKLMFRMNPKNSPVIASIPEVENRYIYGAAKNVATIVIDIVDNQLRAIQELEDTKSREINDIDFIDIDNDGDLDIYLSCGGSAFGSSSPDLKDQLYENDNGIYKNISDRIRSTLNSSTSAAVILDWNNDSYHDILFADSKFHYPYGEKGSVYLLQNSKNAEFKVLEIPALKDVGMITDMDIADIDNDGIWELILVGEWMDKKVYKIEDQQITDVSNLFGFNNSIGIWSDIYLADLDDNGFTDLIFGNCGNNTILDDSKVLVLEDLDDNGRVDQILSQRENEALVPMLDKDDITSLFPHINKHYLKYSAYADASMSDLFGKEKIEEANKYQIQTTETQLILSDEEGMHRFDLPVELQFSSIHSSLYHDVNNDGQKELILAGNHYNVKPQFGREDASRVWCLFTEKEENNFKIKEIRGLGIKGSITSLAAIENGFLLTNTEEQLLRCRIL